METLERLNGRPFQLARFGWDYGGVVLSWSGGQLETLAHGKLGLILDADAAAIATAEGDANYAQVQGDHTFSSGYRAMKALNPRVTGMGINFHP